MDGIVAAGPASSGRLRRSDRRVTGEPLSGQVFLCKRIHSPLIVPRPHVDAPICCRQPGPVGIALSSLLHGR